MSAASRPSPALQAAYRSLAANEDAAARDACLRILGESPEDPGARHLLGLLDYRAGDLVAAEAGLRHAARAPSAAPVHLLSYAELFCKSRDPAGALAMTRRALTLDPALPLGWLSLGTQLLDAQDYGEARSCFEQALRLDPKSWHAQARLAMLLARTGQHDEADRSFERLLEDHPADADLIALHAAYLQDLGRHDRALIEIERAIAAAPDFLEHRLRAAEIELQCDRPEAALERIRAIEPRWGHDAKLCAAKANVLRLLDRSAEALAACRAARAGGSQSPDLLRAFAQALHLEGADDEALTVLDRAAHLQPAPAWSDKAALFASLGRFPEACDCFDRALAIAPALAAAWHDKANAKTFRSGDPDIAAMTRLLEAGCGHRDRMLLNFALGKALFESNALEAAFGHWHEGNRLKRALISYDVEEAVESLRSIAAASAGAAAGALRGAGASEVPVFIVGMPRCGSTLVEQILASHPAVHGGGEQMRLRDSFDSLLYRADAEHEKLAAEAALGALTRRSANAARVIDKDLTNFRYLGVIHRIFPRARIIHCRRDAVDMCFSAYTKLFVGHFPFAYDLRELGLFHRGYRELMHHWSALLPARNFTVVDYETLVSRPEQTMRRLVDFLELPWHEDCERFFETERPIETASAVQVRKPIYRSSIGRSAAVRSHLQPLVAALGDPC